MASFRCPECQHLVSDMAESCPTCQYPLQTSGSIRRSRPVWVYLVCLVYVMLVATITLGPLAFALFTGATPSELLASSLYAVLLLACGLSLVVIPVGHARRRSMPPQTIWFPIIGTATLATIVFFGFALASHEFIRGSANILPEETGLPVFFIAMLLVWIVWLFFLGVKASSGDALRLNRFFYKGLLMGSTLELLIALPMHLVVRRRAVCCAGFATGIGIGVGMLVMMLSIGPALVFLYYHRYQQVYAKHRKSGEQGET